MHLYPTDLTCHHKFIPLILYNFKIDVLSLHVLILFYNDNSINCTKLFILKSSL